jgi:hypothetical protein
MPLCRPPDRRSVHAAGASTRRLGRSTPATSGTAPVRRTPNPSRRCGRRPAPRDAWSLASSQDAIRGSTATPEDAMRTTAITRAVARTLAGAAIVAATLAVGRRPPQQPRRPSSRRRCTPRCPTTVAASRSPSPATGVVKITTFTDGTGTAVRQTVHGSLDHTVYSPWKTLYSPGPASVRTDLATGQSVLTVCSSASPCRGPGVVLATAGRLVVGPTGRWSTSAAWTRSTTRPCARRSRRERSERPRREDQPRRARATARAPR